MFDPNALKKDKAEKAAKAKVLKKIKEWSNNLIPPHIHDGLVLDIKEVVCGDPSCAPVDTVFTLVWPNGRGMFALPYSPEEITQEDLENEFPVSHCFEPLFYCLLSNLAIEY
jgi:hypothetical protein